MTVCLMRWSTIALVLSFAAKMAAAAPVVDQVSPQGNLTLNTNAQGLTWQQSVQTGIAGELASVDLFYQPTTPAPPIQDFRFFVNRGSGWQSDPDDFSAIIHPAVGTINIDLSSANLSFSLGEMFVIGVEGLGPDSQCCAIVGSASPGLYAPGALYLNGLLQVDDNGESNEDMSFVTRVGSVTAAPEPTTLALLGLALAGIGLSRGRKLH